MTKIKSIGTPTWIAPYFEFEHTDYLNDGIISSLRPLRYGWIKNQSAKNLA